MDQIKNFAGTYPTFHPATSMSIETQVTRLQHAIEALPTPHNWEVDPLLDASVGKLFRSRRFIPASKGEKRNLMSFREATGPLERVPCFADVSPVASRGD